MRSFAFCSLNNDNTIKERMALDVITDISGLGFKLKLSTLAGDVADTLTKVVQERQAITITGHLIHNGYARYQILSGWLQKNSKIDSTLVLEYYNGLNRYFIEGKVSDCHYTELDKFDDLTVQIKFTPLTPFFLYLQNKITIRQASVGKSYPFKYPYCYGRNVIENNEIENPYIAEVPLTIYVYGTIQNPVVQLLDENGESYARVEFDDLALQEGQYILINSSARKIWYFNGLSLVDYTAETNPSYDTFLFAKSGTSTVSINLSGSNNGYLVGSWRQYSL